MAPIRAHAILHESTEEREPAGRSAEPLDDYTVVRDPMRDATWQAIETLVVPIACQTVETVRALIAAALSEVSRRAVTYRSVSTLAASRWIASAVQAGHLGNRRIARDGRRRCVWASRCRRSLRSCRLLRCWLQW